MLLVASITPLAVERDSRTYRQAASVARLGYTSIVIEGHPSTFNQDMPPFALRSSGKRVWQTRGGCSKKRGLARIPGVGYARDHLIRYGWQTFLATPAAALYYLHAFNQFPAVWLRCRMHGARYIYDAHDFYSGIERRENLGWVHRALRLRWERWLERCCVRHAAAVVTVSEGVAALLRQAFGCEALVIRNCEDQRLQRPPGRGLRQTIGAAPGDFVFAVVGHAKTGQAMAGLLEALTRVPQLVHVALVGMGYERFSRDIRDCGLAARVHIVPPVKPFEIVRFIESADASLLLYYPRSANYTHCLPNGFFQAIAAGLPLLYPELPDLQKIAREHALGIPINPLSVASIEAGIRTFITQPEQLSEWRRHVTRARDQFTWAAEEPILAGLLHNALTPALSVRV